MHVQICEYKCITKIKLSSQKPKYVTILMSGRYLSCTITYTYLTLSLLVVAKIKIQENA